MKNIDTETLKSNWEKYEAILSKIKDENIANFLESFGERMVMCPYSRTESEPGSYPGGLIERSLEIASAMKKVCDSLKIKIPIASMIKVGLLHDVGKLGDENEPLFIEQDSSWHREKLGQVYKYNEKLPKMSVSHRTLYLLQHFNISLTREEWIAIQLSAGSHFEENRFYVGSEPTLALVLQKSKSLVDHLKNGSV